MRATRVDLSKALAEGGRASTGGVRGTRVRSTLIVLEVLKRYSLDRIHFSVRDLLDGTALEAAALPAPVEGDAPPGAYTCC